MMTNPAGRITQGQFSFLPDLTRRPDHAQIEYGLNKGYAWSVEYTDDPHPRNTYWEMFGNPMFDLKDAAGVLVEMQRLPQDLPQPLHPRDGLRLDARRRVDRDVLHRQPADSEPGFGWQRQEGRRPHDALHDPRLRHRPAGRRALRQPLKRRAHRVMSQPALRDSRLGAGSAGAAAGRATSGRAHGGRRAGAQPGARRCSTSSTATWSAWRRSSSASATSPRCW